MTRYRLTLTALTLSGAMTLGVAPTAFAAPTTSVAQNSLGGQATASSNQGSVGTTPDVYITLDDNTYYQHKDGGWVTEEANVNAELNDDLRAEIAANADIIEQDRANGGDGLGGADLSSNRSSSSGSSNISQVAGIVLPAALVIGGVTWYLNQDGQTYVTEQSRTSAAPSSEEKAASEQMLNDNATEVTEQAIAAQEGDAATDAAADEQAGATDAQDVAPAAEGTATDARAGETAPTDAAVAPRGMAAETGSNTVPRTLAALVLMTILGAAGFVLRRRMA